MFCPKCGEVIDDKSVSCPKCGASTNVNNTPPNVPVNPVPMYTPPAPVAPPKKKKGCLIAVLVCVGLAVLIVIIVAVSGGGDDTKTTDANGNPITTVAATASPQKLDATIKITNSRIGKDYAGKSILIVDYSYTNNTSEATSFTFICTDKAYQDGIECSSIVISDEIDANKALNNVQPGVTYNLSVGYELQNKTSPVQIEVTSLFGGDTFLKQTIALK